MQNAWAEPTQIGYRGRYRDGQGTKRTAGHVKGTTKTAKREAERLAQRELMKIDGGTWFDPARGKTTLAEYIESIWWPNCNLALHTRVSYRSSWDRHIEPRLGHLELRKILPTHVQSWVGALEKAGYAPSTIKKLFVHLQAILAAREGSELQAT